MTKGNRNILQSIAARVDVTKYMSYQDILGTIYQQAKDQIDGYSYLLFAEELGFSKTNVIRLIIVGQRPLTSKAAEKIAIKLGWKGPQRRYWTNLIKYINARLPGERERYFRLLLSYRNQSQPSQLDEIQVAYFNEWYNPVIREMVGLPDFDGTPEWIKKSLNFPLRREEIVRSLELLEKLKIIKFDNASGRYEKCGKNIITDSEIDSMAIVRYHQKMIEIARESITRTDETSRDIRALTLSIPESAVPVLKGKIEEWLHEAMKLEEQSSNEVYQLNIQLFPFTKNAKD